MQSQLLPRIKPCLTAASFSQKELSYHKVTTMNHTLNLRGQWQNGKKWSNSFSISILRPIFTCKNAEPMSCTPVIHTSGDLRLFMSLLLKVCVLSEQLLRLWHKKSWYWNTGSCFFSYEKSMKKFWAFFLFSKGLVAFHELLGFSKRNRMNIPRNTATFTFHSDVKTSEGQNHPRTSVNQRST